MGAEAHLRTWAGSGVPRKWGPLLPCCLARARWGRFVQHVACRVAFPRRLYKDGLGWSVSKALSTIDSQKKKGFPLASLSPCLGRVSRLLGENGPQQVAASSWD